MSTDQGFDHNEPELGDECVADDSTECDCSRCTAAEDRFWREQGEQRGELDEDDFIEPDDGEDRP